MRYSFFHKKRFIKVLLFLQEGLFKKNYSVDYFIKKFDRIPEHKWCVGRFYEYGNKKCCGGHCGAFSPGDMRQLKETRALAALLNSAGIYSVVWKQNSVMVISDINDGDHPAYQQATPKKRILAALNDVKRKQARTFPTRKNISAQVAMNALNDTYPVVAESLDIPGWEVNQVSMMHKTKDGF